MQVSSNKQLVTLTYLLLIDKAWLIVQKRPVTIDEMKGFVAVILI